MVKNGQLEELTRLLRHPKPFIEFVLEQSVHAFDMNNPKAKEEALHSGIAYLKTLSPILQEEYRPYLAALLNINKSVVRLQNTPQNKQSPSFSAPLTREDVWELSLIKSIIEVPALVENILDYLDPSQLNSHQQEFALAINNQYDHPLLVKISLNDSIKAFKEEDLKNELLTFLSNYYNLKRKQVLSDVNLPGDKRMFLNRKYSEKVNKLRRGELVPFQD
jgi:DNA primase